MSTFLNTGLKAAITDGSVSATSYQDFPVSPPKTTTAFEQLETIDNAAFDSFAEQHNKTCMDGTRVEILQNIELWTTNPDARCIYWLKGMAGSGKSTIARTVARRLCDNNRLAGSFFFKRGEGPRSDARYLFPTLSKQIVEYIAGTCSLIENRVRANPRIATQSLRHQFEELIYHPLHDLGKSALESKVFIAVIDALDECDSVSDVQAIVRLFQHFYHQLGLSNLRLFITSRPEAPIRHEFGRLEQSIYSPVVLQKIQEKTIYDDIALYLHSELRTWSEEPATRRLNLQISAIWPSKRKLDSLTRMATPLFISASTACRFIKEHKRGLPDERLSILLSHNSYKTGSLLGSIYKPILDQVLVGFDEEELSSVKSDFHKVVGTIVLAFEPISASTVETFHEIRQCDITAILDSLHSILDVPEPVDSPIRPFHLSFHDYLVSDKQHSEWFWIDEHGSHSRMASRCLDLLSDNLLQNPFNVQDPGTQRIDLERSTILEAIPVHIAYACRYWAKHLELSNRPVQDDDEVHRFLKTRLAFWVETSGWLGFVTDCLAMVQSISSLLQEPCSQIRELLHDANRFLRQNLFILDLAPLQLYSSCLRFAPQSSLVRAESEVHISHDLCMTKHVTETWGSEMQKLEHHEIVVHAAFSPDGKVIASLTGDGAVAFWSPSTGRRTHELGIKDKARYIAFSPVGEMLAVATAVGTSFWDPVTGLELEMSSIAGLDGPLVFSPNGQLLAGHQRRTEQTVLWDMLAKPDMRVHKNFGQANEVAFSQDGAIIAFNSYLRDTYVWDLTLGHAKPMPKDYGKFDTPVSFSPVGHVLASGELNGIPRIWNVSTGVELERLKPEVALPQSSHGILSMAFSPRGDVLATGTTGGIISVWDLESGQELQRLIGQPLPITSIEFSPDGKTLASAGYETSICLWDPSSQPTSSKATSSVQRLKGLKRGITSMLFSPDGLILAAAYKTDDYKPQIVLWDSATGSELHTFDGSNAQNVCLAFSFDGGMLASPLESKVISLLDPVDGQLLQTLKGHEDYISCVTFSQDGMILASGSEDKTVRLWDLQTGLVTHKLDHVEEVCSVAFSPNGKMLICGSAEKIFFWDLVSKIMTKTLKDGRRHVGVVLWISKDGLILISCDSFGRDVWVWDTSTGTQIARSTSDDMNPTFGFPELGYKAVFEGNCRLSIQSSTRNNLQNGSIQETQLSLSEDNIWVRRRGKNFLWLPEDYRGVSCVSSHGILAIISSHPVPIFIKIIDH
ncbi:hypothetical protein K461DRAFT_315461 [Myriangium duriaei CBS 260.36]|uniref:Nephrocystin 3-like N-terminal domain-containing protein n=1 Tax=Myriangium duriaei CBS 260.36 TaxID=1168546 RepID=A0A9P4MGY6_9PEZI|nr:hypothetical protein K461DRAFT_315461 [Myriangium duriaei CBS 260.36]